MTRFALAALALVGLSGCYISSPPTRPHGHVELVPSALQDLPDRGGAPPAHALRSPRVVVLGRFDSEATQPIGGLYDDIDSHLSPLYRTYFFRDAHLEVFEHVADALRAAGLDVRKDYASAGEAPLVEERVKKLDPILVRGLVKSLQHDQVRVEKPLPGEFEVARLVIAVRVTDVAGRQLYERELKIEGKRPIGPETDLLRTLGRALGEALAEDAGFRRAVGAS